ncbi:hypothetical protein GOP47_0028472 [Adiantum capillus-veneris]|nr:hypothetical protein GOP47_0028472 [Adiantum capillus-veneris]
MLRCSGMSMRFSSSFPCSRCGQGRGEAGPSFSRFPQISKMPGIPEADFGRFDVTTVIKRIYILFCNSEMPIASGVC